jgi:hypothetical protein
MDFVPAEDFCGRLIRDLLKTCSVGACFVTVDKEMSLYSGRRLVETGLHIRRYFSL